MQSQVLNKFILYKFDINYNRNVQLQLMHMTGAPDNTAFVPNALSHTRF